MASGTEISNKFSGSRKRRIESECSVVSVGIICAQRVSTGWVVLSATGSGDPIIAQPSSFVDCSSMSRRNPDERYGVSTGTNSTVVGVDDFLARLRRMLIMPPTGPVSGNRSVTASWPHPHRGVPLKMVLVQPAAISVRPARNNNGSPSRQSAALSRPMRLDLPPARTTPTASVMTVCAVVFVIGYRTMGAEGMPLNPFAITIKIVLLLPDWGTMLDFLDDESARFE